MKQGSLYYLLAVLPLIISREAAESAETRPMNLLFVCAEDNDLFRVLSALHTVMFPE